MAVVIIDYGVGNIGSIKNMLERLGEKPLIINSALQLAEADKIILPGVGSFDTGMDNLQEGGWIEPLNEMVLHKKTPVLGICLGMQLMTAGSEEGNRKGLSWIDASTVRFQFENKQLYKVPHMGWNIVHPREGHMLFSGIEKEQKFYHVHSYYVKLNNAKEEIAHTDYGFSFTSAFHKDNILGVQFHPEKSHKFGMNLLKNFAEKF